MASPPILMTFAIGRNAGKVRADSNQGVGMITNAIGEEVTRLVAKATQFNIPQLAANLKRNVETSYTDAVRYAARRMIGRMNGSEGGSDWGVGKKRTESQELFIGGQFAADWHPLSVRQYKTQRLHNPGITRPRFFLDTGALKTELLSFARQMVKQTGVVKVEIRNDNDGWKKPLKSTKLVHVADVRIKLLPNIYASQLPGIRSGVVSDFNLNMNFERALGLSESTIEKLRGPIVPNQEKGLYHRPLLQPVFTYWTLYQVPGVVAEVLARNIYNPKRSASSGVADNSVGR